jgi:hypothetical protein
VDTGDLLHHLCGFENCIGSMKMDAFYGVHITTTENTSILQTTEHFTFHFLSAIKAVPFCILTSNVRCVWYDASSILEPTLRNTQCCFTYSVPLLPRSRLTCRLRPTNVIVKYTDIILVGLKAHPCISQFIHANYRIES